MTTREPSSANYGSHASSDGVRGDCPTRCKPESRTALLGAKGKLHNPSLPVTTTGETTVELVGNCPACSWSYRVPWLRVFYLSCWIIRLLSPNELICLLPRACRHLSDNFQSLGLTFSQVILSFPILAAGHDLMTLDTRFCAQTCVAAPTGWKKTECFCGSFPFCPDFGRTSWSNLPSSESPQIFTPSPRAVLNLDLRKSLSLPRLQKDCEG